MLPEGAEGRRNVHIGRARTHRSLKIKLADEVKRAPGGGKCLLLLAGLPVMADQLPENHQLSAPVAPELRLVQPVEKMALRAGVVPPGHVLVHFLHDPLLRHRPALRDRAVGISAENTLRLEIILRSDDAHSSASSSIPVFSFRRRLRCPAPSDSASFDSAVPDFRGP